MWTSLTNLADFCSSFLFDMTTFRAHFVCLSIDGRENTTGAHFQNPSPFSYSFFAMSGGARAFYRVNEQCSSFDEFSTFKGEF